MSKHTDFSRIFIDRPILAAVLSIFVFIAGLIAMLLSMPLMVAGAGNGHGPVADPLMRWVMESLTPPLRNSLPQLYALPPEALSWSLLGLTVFIMAWAGRHF